MTSKEVVRRTLEYENPERVAVSFDKTDIIGCRYDVETQATDWRCVSDRCWERTDEWGNTWGRVDATSKGEVIHGVLESINDVLTYQGPDFSREEDYAPVRIRRNEYPDRWLNGILPGFAFNIARKMRKFDQYLMDIIIEVEKIRILHDKIDRMLRDMIVNYARAGVDAVMITEDWGTQTGLLINPVLWMQEFYPRFRTLCSLAHENGMYVWMHSCGQVEPIVPALMDAGIDVLQFDQPELHGIDTLAAHQNRKKITFWCPVDIQKTLQTGHKTVIQKKVREMLDKLWKGRGGFIAGYYSDTVSIGIDEVWQSWACDEFRRYGTREHDLQRAENTFHLC